MTGIRCMLMRGGTSKGAYFLADDLPADAAERDDLLLRIMGSPDPRQIDGIGGGHPLTSKVAVISPSASAGTDVDYLFLQVGVDQAFVTDRQNCGNLLAGVGPFAVDRGLVPPGPVRIKMVNTGDIATATFDPARTEGGAEIVIGFGGSGGSLLPTGGVRDWFGGIEATCVDAGMPVVVVSAASFDRTGYESVAELEADEDLRSQVNELRLAAGKAMGLGDVSGTTIPKVSLVAPPVDGGTISTRTYIPVRVHEAIGVLGAVSVGAAVLIDGSVAADAASPDASGRIDIEHPGGHMRVEVALDTHRDPPSVLHAGVVRTARKLFDGVVFPRRA
jgi:4-oxalomesaconate tautomerase